MKNKRFLAARKRRRWTQEKISEITGVSVVTVSRWENGSQQPHTTTLDLICSAFGMSPEDLGFEDQAGEMVEETASEATATPSLPLRGLQDDTALSPGFTRLTMAQAATLSSLLPLREGEGDIMARFDPKRRAAFALLLELIGSAEAAATIPFVNATSFLENLTLTQAKMADVDSTVIQHFASFIVDSWSLLKVDGLPLVEILLPKYLPDLEQLTKQPSKQQSVFAGLATQGCMLAGLVAVLQLNLSQAEMYCKRAVQYSRVAGDRNLEVAALKHLATKYTDAKYPRRALQTYQEALPLVDQVSPLLRSRTYLGLALSYAQCGQESEAFQYLGLSQETFPEYPEKDLGFSYADCGPSSLNHYGGLIYLEFDKPKEAWSTLAGVEQLKTKIVIPERTVIEILNCQAEAAVAQKELDLAYAHVQAGVDGALRLKSEMRFNDTYSVYKQMKLIWPREPKVRELADLFQR